MVLLSALVALIAGYFLVDGPTAALISSVVLLPVIVLAAVRMPGAVFAFYLYIPFYKGAINPLLPIDLTVLLAVACVGLFVLNIKKGTALGTGSVLVLWSDILLVLTIGTLYAAQPDIALAHLANFALLVFAPLLLAIVVMQEQKFVDQFLYSTVLLAVAVTLFGIVQLGGLGTYDRVEGLSSTIGTARSAFLLPLLLPTIIAIGPRWVSVLGVLVSPLAIFVVVASGSRGPLLFGLALMALGQFLVREGLARRILFGVLALAVVTGVVQSPQIQQYLPEQSAIRVQGVIDALIGEGEVEDLSSARVQLFDLATEMFLQRPIFGYGTAGFESVTQGIPSLQTLTYPHNAILQIAADFGLLGVILFLSFIYVAFKRANAALISPRYRGLFILALFAFLNSMVSSDIYDNRWMWGMLMMLISIQPHGDTEQDHVTDSSRGI